MERNSKSSPFYLAGQKATPPGMVRLAQMATYGQSWGARPGGALVNARESARATHKANRETTSGHGGNH
jgi:hypothetical protein